MQRRQLNALGQALGPSEEDEALGGKDAPRRLLPGCLNGSVCHVLSICTPLHHTAPFAGPALFSGRPCRLGFLRRSPPTAAAATRSATGTRRNHCRPGACASSRAARGGRLSCWLTFRTILSHCQHCQLRASSKRQWRTVTSPLSCLEIAVVSPIAHKLQAKQPETAEERAEGALERVRQRAQEGAAAARQQAEEGASKLGAAAQQRLEEGAAKLGAAAQREGGKVPTRIGAAGAAKMEEGAASVKASVQQGASWAKQGLQEGASELGAAAGVGAVKERVEEGLESAKERVEQSAAAAEQGLQEGAARLADAVRQGGGDVAAPATSMRGFLNRVLAPLRVRA